VTIRKAEVRGGCRARSNEPEEVEDLIRDADMWLYPWGKARPHLIVGSASLPQCSGNNRPVAVPVEPGDQLTYQPDRKASPLKLHCLRHTEHPYEDLGCRNKVASAHAESRSLHASSTLHRVCSNARRLIQLGRVRDGLTCFHGYVTIFKADHRRASMM